MGKYRDQRRPKGSQSGNQNHRGSRRSEPEVECLSEFEAQLEYEANKVRFGPLAPRNKNQRYMIQCVKDRRITFVTGPAGVGKTFISTSIAAELLEAGAIKRIIITRPMVGCDEEMGFLPGTEQEKFQPWLGPYFDVLEGKLGKKKLASYLKFGYIVAQPLMMMRGCTFRDAMVLLDEAQNTTPKQMKMFLTRIGEGSRVVVDGDLEQSDIPGEGRNGLADAMHRLSDSTSVAFVKFEEDDITRDPLVRDIVKAYRR